MYGGGKKYSKICFAFSNKMRIGKPVRTNIWFNASLRKDEPNPKIVSVAYYEPPLPPACPRPTNGVQEFSCGGSGSGSGGSGGGIGSSGLWTLSESLDGGARFLSVKFGDQTVHTFQANDS